MALKQTRQGKVKPNVFATIRHFPGLKIVEPEDKLLGIERVKRLNMRQRINGSIIVTEKTNGMDIPALRRDRCLYPFTRKGNGFAAEGFHGVLEGMDYAAFPPFDDAPKQGQRPTPPPPEKPGEGRRLLGALITIALVTVAIVAVVKTGGAAFLLQAR